MSPDLPQHDVYVYSGGQRVLVTRAGVDLIEGLRPDCMRCGRPVGAMDVQGTPAALIIVIECHGDLAEITITAAELLDVGSITVGPCFPGDH